MIQALRLGRVTQRGINHDQGKYYTAKIFLIQTVSGGP